MIFLIDCEDVHLVPCQTSTIEAFAKTVNRSQPYLFLQNAAS